ncbi:MAG: type II secretion system F family protein [Candidatus Omnitrophica bacterium]|nr:type II secretion system F family protein [Candidatus Omnitrophota bacterium]
MPTFTYKAKLGPSKLEQGSIEAENQEQAIKKISDLGLFPVEVRPYKQSKNISLFARFGQRNKIKNQEVISLTRQLASLLEAGLNILPALNAIKSQLVMPALVSLVDDIAQNVKDGASFSESLSHHKDIFSSLYINVVRSGELSGRLNHVLDTLADFLEKGEDLRQRIISALVYPVLVLAVGILTVAVLLIFVIPRIGVMFEDMGQVLPLPTQIVVGISSMIVNYFFVFFAIIVVLFFFINKRIKTKEGRIFVDRSKLKTPLLGMFIRKQHIVQFSRTLSLLLASGIPIVTALELVANTLSNGMIRQEVKTMSTAIREGASLSTSIKESKYFPAFVSSIIAVAEESGSLDRSLARLASSFERDVERIIKTFTVALEPTLIFLIGLVVGFIVIAMLLPIFQINLIVG